MPRAATMPSDAELPLLHVPCPDGSEPEARFRLCWLRVALATLAFAGVLLSGEHLAAQSAPAAVDLRKFESRGAGERPPSTRPAQPGPIQSGDRLQISVMDVVGPGIETYGSIRVPENGSIEFTGLGTIEADGKTTLEFAEELARLLATAQWIERANVNVEIVDGPTTLPASTRAPTPPNLRVDPDVEEALKRRLPKVSIENAAFTDCLDLLGHASGVHIAADWEAIEEAGIKRTAPIELRMHDVPFETVLGRVLTQAAGNPDSLQYLINDNVIVVSTAAALRSEYGPKRRRSEPR